MRFPLGTWQTLAIIPTAKILWNTIVFTKFSSTNIQQLPVFFSCNIYICIYNVNKFQIHTEVNIVCLH